eukprot:comp21259_c0_seq1/m.28979 comp21259_c0_seq1/g.28979  ORF comp21259_c0_seq1/g.28979 comp21259_c0_seq1/m.28979 type:complete len:289 (-) comp21259_c0_seq1:429-1295(-)
MTRTILLAVLAAFLALHPTHGVPVPQVNALERMSQLEKSDMVTGFRARKRFRRFGADDDEDGAVMDEDEEEDVPPILPARGVAQAIAHNDNVILDANNGFAADEIDEEDGEHQTNSNNERLDPEADEDEVMSHQQRQEETERDENGEDAQGQVVGYDSVAADPEGDSEENRESDASRNTSENEEARANERGQENSRMEEIDADDVSIDINEEGESLEKMEDDVDLDSMSEEEGEDMVTGDFLFEVEDGNDKPASDEGEAEAAVDEAGKGAAEVDTGATEDDYNEEDDE